jgi:hypothetical protein
MACNYYSSTACISIVTRLVVDAVTTFKTNLSLVGVTKWPVIITCHINGVTRLVVDASSRTRTTPFWVRNSERCVVRTARISRDTCLVVDAKRLRSRRKRHTLSVAFTFTLHANSILELVTVGFYLTRLRHDSIVGR